MLNIDEVTIHGQTDEGMSVCGFPADPDPRKWPDTEYWTPQLNDKNITCVECRRLLDLPDLAPVKEAV